MHGTWTRLETCTIAKKGKRKGQKVYDYHCNICNRDFQNCTNAAAHVKSCQDRLSQLKKVQSYTIMNAFGIEESNIHDETFNYQLIVPQYKSNEPISKEHQ